MTNPTPRVLTPIHDEVRARLEAAKVGLPTTSAIPDDVHAAINAGHIGQVGIYCDECGVTVEMDCVGATKADRFAAARQHLADNAGWKISDDEDLCPVCAGYEPQP